MGDDYMTKSGSFHESCATGDSRFLRPPRGAANAFAVAPRLGVGNSFDFLHLRHVHGFAFDFDPEKIRWSDDHRSEVEIGFASPDFGRFERRIRVTGPSAVSCVTVAEATGVGLFASTPVGSVAQSFVVAACPTASPAAPFE